MMVGWVLAIIWFAARLLTGPGQRLRLWLIYKWQRRKEGK